MKVFYETTILIKKGRIFLGSDGAGLGWVFSAAALEKVIYFQQLERWTIFSNKVKKNIFLLNDNLC